MTRICSANCIKTIVKIQATHQIVSGAIWLINVALVLQQDSELAGEIFTGNSYVSFYIRCKILTVLLAFCKEPFLLYSVKKGNTKGVLKYFILSCFVLVIELIFTVLVIKAFFDTGYDEREDDSIAYFIVFPILSLVFAWFYQFCVFVCILNLKREDFSRLAEVETPLIQMESE